MTSGVIQATEVFFKFVFGFNKFPIIPKVSYIKLMAKKEFVICETKVRFKKAYQSKDIIFRASNVRFKE